MTPYYTHTDHQFTSAMTAANGFALFHFWQTFLQNSFLFTDDLIVEDQIQLMRA